MTQPTLGLALTPPTDPALLDLLVHMRRWCAVRQADSSDPVDAWMVTEGVDPALVSAGPLVLVWTRNPASAAPRWSGRGILVGPASSMAGWGGLSIPDTGVDATDAEFMAPVVRQRWRRRLALPPHTVIHLGDEGVAGLPARLEVTALATAAVVVASGDAVLRAMAWGAPTVTDPETAARLDLGGSVRVAATGEGEHVARALCNDEHAMALLAWRGRQRVEERHDLVGAAYRVAEAARIVPVADPTGGVLSLLTELWASPATAVSMLRAVTA